MMLLIENPILFGEKRMQMIHMHIDVIQVREHFERCWEILKLISRQTERRKIRKIADCVGNPFHFVYLLKKDTQATQNS